MALHIYQFRGGVIQSPRHGLSTYQDFNDKMKSPKEIIDAADKYGVVNLKLEVEACFVEGTTSR